MKTGARVRLRVGAEVILTMTGGDGEVVRGQIWSLTVRPGFAWVALEDGRFVALNVAGYAYASPRATERLGRVA